MPNITNLRRTIGSYLGQVITPEIAAAIEVSSVVDTPTLNYHPEQHGSLTCGEFVIQVELMADILAELHPLHAEHWLETEKHRHGLTMDPDYTSMLADERAGRLIQFTVRKAGALVGNLRMYVRESRHTKTLMAMEDTLYLRPDARGGMTAVYLLRFAEKTLRAIGVREIEADSKLLNNADTLMRRLKYQPVAIRFSKIFKEDCHV